MWLFKRKTKSPPQKPIMPICPYCQSSETKIVTHHGTGEESYIKVWRGQRFVTYKCLKCGKDFYSEESPTNIEFELNNDQLIDDPGALQAAEEELKKELENDDDRTCR